MIIDFTVRNYKSINAQQTLDFVASTDDRHLAENLIPTVHRRREDDEDFKLLRGVVIHGGNGSGKTNLLLSMQFMIRYVSGCVEDYRVGDLINTQFFLLREGGYSEFEMHFIAEGTRYRYSVDLDRTRVIREQLSTPINGRIVKIFERCWDRQDSKYSYTSGTGFKLDPQLIRFTRDNAMFLSVCAKWNVKELAPAYLWFRKRRDSVCTEVAYDYKLTARLYNSSAQQNEDILRIVKELHPDVDTIEAKSYEIRECKHWYVYFRMKQGFTLGWEEAPTGLRHTFCLAGHIVKTLHESELLVLDDIDAWLDAPTTAKLTRLLSDKCCNPGCQFVVTRRTYCPQQADYLRNDQSLTLVSHDDGSFGVVHTDSDRAYHHIQRYNRT